MKSVSRKGFLVRGTTTQEVAISMEDAFWVLERGLGFTDAYSLGVRDGKLVRAEDMSHHGSPEYAFTELSNNPKWAELFRAFQRLREYKCFSVNWKIMSNPWAAGPCRRVTSARGKTTDPSPCR